MQGGFVLKLIRKAKKRLIVYKALYKSKLKIGGCLCLAFAIAFAGFMGVDQFDPEQRTVRIGANADMIPVVTTVVRAAEVNARALEHGLASGLEIDAKAALLMDAGSGTVLFEKNADEQLPPASVTKVMTMLLVMEAVARGQVMLDDMVTISERAARMGGSQMYMEPGEQHTLSELMLGIAMASANDACVAVAEHVSGTVEIFVERMNQRAAELGMENTNFVNTNGLPVANHFSSAYDIALMSRELLRHPISKEWFTTWQHTIHVGLPGRETEFVLTNTNRLIRQYTGADGIKTGFTQDAGYCLSGSATRGEMTLIAVVLGSPSSQIRFDGAMTMLDYGFATYDTVKIAQQGEPLGSVRIEKGNPDIVNAVADQDLFILVKKGEQDGITTGLELAYKMRAPLEKGQKLGDIIIFENGQEIERHPLIAEEKIEKASFSQLYIRMMKNLI